MEIFRRRVLIAIDEDDLPSLDLELREALYRGWKVRRAHPPRRLLNLAGLVNAEAESSGFRDSTAGQDPARNSRLFRAGSSLQSSDQPFLSARAAAKIAGCSVEYMRRACSRGDVKARQRGGYRSAWQVDASDLDRWVTSRRRENKQKAA